MSKTPEQLAQEWSVTEGGYLGFLAGYRAASEKYEAEIKELKENFTFCCEDKGEELEAKGSAPWVDVRDGLPELDVQCFWIDVKLISLNALAARSADDCEVWWNNYTHWLPLPKLPTKENYEH